MFPRREFQSKKYRLLILDSYPLLSKHMVFGKEEGLPEHYSNSNVYMNVIRGKLSIGLNDQEVHIYEKGTLLEIPYNTKMNVGNKDEDVLELVVVKAPAPQNYKK
ncbi:cupin domain-containing protein [Acetoanaerobium noterae]|nr:cupin domain-containing protein [Acetoanaerobium noterae]